MSPTFCRRQVQVLRPNVQSDGSLSPLAHDEDGTQRIGLGVGTDGTGLLGMFGENTLTRVIVQESDSSGALTLCDAEGKQVWTAP